MVWSHGAVHKLTQANALPQLQPPRWALEELVGRLVEISGNAVVSAAMAVIVDAQQNGHPCAWVSAGEPLFFPPDAAEGGVDLAALLVVRAGEPERAARAADKLLRSSGFGVVVVDLGASHRVSMASQARLVKLAQKHNATALMITDKRSNQPSLSSLVSLRCAAERTWVGGDRFRCEVRSLKDKRRGPVWTDSELLRGPPGAGDVQGLGVIERRGHG